MVETSLTPDRYRERSAAVSLALLILSQVLVLSVWFSAAAVIAPLAADLGQTRADLAHLAAATQVGFVVGAVLSALTGIADRFDPRRIFLFSALAAALANAALLVLPADSTAAAISRMLVGVFLAGVYPVGLKIAMGWSIRRRGLLASLLVGALTFGSALPQLITAFGGADWRLVIIATTILACVGGVLMLQAGLGPHHASAARFDPTQLRMVFTVPKLKRAYLGYFGHMWELYAFWAWAPAILVAAGIGGGAEGAGRVAAGLVFAAMVLGAFACGPFGLLADRIGKGRTAELLLIGSALSGFLATVSFDLAPWFLVFAIFAWAVFIIPDSPLFSAMVADAAPPSATGSLLTLQTAIGFALTILTVQATPVLADLLGWQATLGMMVVGPVLGLAAMRAYRETPSPRNATAHHGR